MLMCIIQGKSCEKCRQTDICVLTLFLKIITGDIIEKKNKTKQQEQQQKNNSNDKQTKKSTKQKPQLNKNFLGAEQLTQAFSQENAWHLVESKWWYSLYQNNIRCL